MEALIYLIKSSVVFSLLYMIYHVFYRKSTFFQLNRAYLLAIIPLSLITPYIKWTQVVSQQYTLELPMLELGTHSFGNSASMNQLSILLGCYVLVASIVLVKFIVNLIQLGIKISHLKKGKELSLQAFSFFYFIYIPKEVESNNLDAIIKHERVHARQVHSLDILIYELLKALFWWNPVVWMASNSVRINHEYIADNVASKDSTENYSSVLIAQLLGVNCSMLANNFNYKPLIKKRIMMMKAKKSKTVSVLNYALIIPVIALFATVSTGEKVAAKSVVSDLINQDKVYDNVEVQPEFKGGMDGLIKYMTENINYPKETGLTGNVYVSFVVDEKGKVSQAEVVKSAGEPLDKEALRVVNAMPNWTPGKDKGENVKVKMTLPISFKLE